jgi:hypothetical protein
MEKILIAVLCIGLPFSAAIAQDDELKNLDAQYRLTTKHLIDPDPKDVRDRVAIYIEGKSAKEIYEAMLGPAQQMDCDGSPSKERYFIKRAGGLECSFEENAKEPYYCSVAITLDTGETADGYICEPQ